MRLLVLLAASGLAATPAHAFAQRGLQRHEQAGAYLAMQQGEVLFDQVVLVMKSVTMAKLFKGRFQWRDE